MLRLFLFQGFNFFSSSILLLEFLTPMKMIKFTFLLHKSKRPSMSSKLGIPILNSIVIFCIILRDLSLQKRVRVDNYQIYYTCNYYLLFSEYTPTFQSLPKKKDGLRLLCDLRVYTV